MTLNRVESALSELSDEENDTWASSQDWKRLCNEYQTAGFREGMEEGRSKAVQEGFDQAFRIALRRGILCGRALAIVRTGLQQLYNYQRDSRNTVTTMHVSTNSVSSVDNEVYTTTNTRHANQSNTQGDSSSASSLHDDHNELSNTKNVNGTETRNGDNHISNMSSLDSTISTLQQQGQSFLQVLMHDMRANLRSDVPHLPLEKSEQYTSDSAPLEKIRKAFNEKGDVEQKQEDEIHNAEHTRDYTLLDTQFITNTFAPFLMQVLKWEKEVEYIVHRNLNDATNVNQFAHACSDDSTTLETILKVSIEDTTRLAQTWLHGQ